MTPPPIRFNRKPEKDLPVHNRVWPKKRGRAGTAVPDAAASYTQPRGPDPRTTACGGRKERESGYGCAGRRGIIYSNERGRVGSGHGCPRYRGIIHSTPDPLQL